MGLALPVETVNGGVDGAVEGGGVGEGAVGALGEGVLLAVAPAALDGVELRRGGRGSHSTREPRPSGRQRRPANPA